MGKKKLLCAQTHLYAARCLCRAMAASWSRACTTISSWPAEHWARPFWPGCSISDTREFSLSSASVSKIDWKRRRPHNCISSEIIQVMSHYYSPNIFCAEITTNGRPKRKFEHYHQWTAQKQQRMKRQVMAKINMYNCYPLLYVQPITYMIIYSSYGQESYWKHWIIKIMKTTVPKGNTEIGSWELLVTTFLSTGQYVTLFNVCLHTLFNIHYRCINPELTTNSSINNAWLKQLIFSIRHITALLHLETLNSSLGLELWVILNNKISNRKFQRCDHK